MKKQAVKPKGRLVPFEDYLLERMRDKEQARSYFDAILQETAFCTVPEAKHLILSALRIIAQAQGGITKLAEKLELPCGTVSRALSPQGNPRLNTYLAVQNALFAKR